MSDIPEKANFGKFLSYILLIIVVVLAGAFFLSRGQNTNNTQGATTERESSSSGSMKQYTSPPQLTINTNKKYVATLATSEGPIKIELFASETPQTVNNFIFLAKDGFYNNTVFHRIIRDFMVQGGDPKGDGTGGPGYKFDDEKITRDYKRGIVAMANSGPNTNGSQFFIMHKDNNLPKNYVVFGMVTEGLNVLDNIAETPVVDNGMGEVSKPTKKVEIKSIAVSEQ